MFCKYCGKEIAEGEVCSCQVKEPAAEQKVENTAPEMEQKVENAAPVTEQKAAEINVNQYKEIAVKALKEIPAILKAPVTEGKAFVKKADSAASGVILLVRAILSGIFSILAISKINSLIGLAGSYLENYKFSGGKAFFITILFSLLFSAIYAGLLLAMAKVLKANTNFKEAIALSAVSAIGTIPIIVISLVVFLLNIPAGVAIFFGASLLGLLYTAAVAEGMEGLDNNKALYGVFVVSIIFVPVVVYIMSKGATLYVPDSIKDQIGNIGSLTSLIENFL